MKDDIIRRFSMYFPSIHKRAVEMHYNKYMTLFVRTDDGQAFIYDDLDHFIRKLPDNKDEMTEDEFKREFAHRLRRLMRVKGVTQEVLSERTGLSQAAISRYISGSRIPNLYAIDKIARALRCTVDELRYIE